VRISFVIRLYHDFVSPGVCVMVVIIPWLILAILPVTISYYYLLLHYRKSGSDLQRLDAVSRSPIQAMVSEALDGCSTIRVFDQQSTFISRFRAAVDVNSSALLNFVTAQRYAFIVFLLFLINST
jgi:ABC-type multidrug transport system fused ATPase/permease subunit